MHINQNQNQKIILHIHTIFRQMTIHQFNVLLFYCNELIFSQRRKYSLANDLQCNILYNGWSLKHKLNEKVHSFSLWILWNAIYEETFEILIQSTFILKIIQIFFFRILK